MSEIESALPTADGQTSASDRITAIPSDVSMMTLDAGLYCVVVQPSPAADAASGLPGVRITQAPGTAGRAEHVTVRTIAADGWMSGFGDAALVRVTGGQAQVMISIYHRPNAGSAGAPKLQVLPLLRSGAEPGGQALPAAPQANLPAPSAMPADGLPHGAPQGPAVMDMVAHIQKRGDVGARFSEWLGVPGSGHWIEGFGIAPVAGVALADIEYQAVLGRGWLSPWVEGGQFCGSRGMALPILGLRVRLRGEAVNLFTLRIQASFIDGSKAGPVSGGESCEAESLAAVEAILIELLPIGAEGAGSPAGGDQVGKGAAAGDAAKRADAKGGTGKPRSAASKGQTRTS